MRETVWHAPGRVNLIGEHTDYNDGFVLPFAIPLGVTARVRRRDDRMLRVASGSYPDEVAEFDVDALSPGPGWAAYVAGVVWTLRQRGYDVGGADIQLESDLPAGAGLSSSAAVECAVAGAVSDAFDLRVDVPVLVDVAHAAEHDYVGVPCGVLDQSAVLRCRAGRALFLDIRSMQARQVPLPLAEQGLAVLVVDTCSPHRLLDGEYAARRAQCRRAAELLGVPALRDATPESAQALPDDLLRRRARHVVTENARVLDTVQRLDAGDVRGIGPLLTASHDSLRDDFEVSARRLDLAVDTSVASGALGARMTGGGFGGSAIALVEADRVDDVTDALRRDFADARLAEPRMFPAVAAGGAGHV